MKFTNPRALTFSINSTFLIQNHVDPLPSANFLGEKNAFWTKSSLVFEVFFGHGNGYLKIDFQPWGHNFLLIGRNKQLFCFSRMGISQNLDIFANLFGLFIFFLCLLVPFAFLFIASKLLLPTLWSFFFPWNFGWLSFQQRDEFNLLIKEHYR